MQHAHEAFSHAMTHLGQYSTSLSLEKVIEVAASDFTKGAQQANAIDLKQVADEWIKKRPACTTGQERTLHVSSYAEKRKSAHGYH